MGLSLFELSNKKHKNSILSERVFCGGESRSVKELVLGLADIKINGNPLQEVTSLTLDSRQVVPGALFIAISGQKEDGYKYIPEAISRGAVAIMVSKPYESSEEITVIQVKDIRSAMTSVARRFYDFPDEVLDLIGITGTNGKTTVASLSQYLLNEFEYLAGMIGTVHYDLGKLTLPATKTTPESIDLQKMFDQMLQGKCKAAIMEVSSHGIILKRVENTPFDIAVFLNLTQDHLDFHGDMENYFQAKVQLFTGKIGCLPKVAIVNIDDAYGRRLIEYIPSKVKIITFGLSKDAMVRAHNVCLTDQGLSFDLHWPEGEIEVKSSLLGSYNVSNVLAALSIGWISGRSMSALVLKLKDFSGVRGRMESVDVGQPFLVLVDYAHTGDALFNALKILREITVGRLLVVFGCGGERDRGKRRFMTEAAQKWADIAWATADNPRGEDQESIFKDMREWVISPKKMHFITERRRAIEKALEEAQEGDCVLIAGKGHETYQLIGNSCIPFDDCEVARELLIFKNKANVCI